mmetsp:Transcript_49267/g.119459  ORF Transcript_49267/g.119459 Transcript_49267/m.119459 type:complete len:229 (+) Transcript_49267:488-1174(+)
MVRLEGARQRGAGAHDHGVWLQHLRALLLQVHIQQRAGRRLVGTRAAHHRRAGPVPDARLDALGGGSDRPRALQRAKGGRRGAGGPRRGGAGPRRLPLCARLLRLKRLCRAARGGGGEGVVCGRHAAHRRRHCGRGKLRPFGCHSHITVYAAQGARARRQHPHDGAILRCAGDRDHHAAADGGQLPVPGRGGGGGVVQGTYRHLRVRGEPPEGDRAKRHPHRGPRARG